MNGNVVTKPEGKKVRLVEPSFLIEYAYFALLVYSMFGQAWGVTVRLIGSATIAGLAFMCLLLLGKDSFYVLKPIRFALGCAFGFIVIQLGVHQEGFGLQEIRSFVTWVLSLIVIQTLSLRRGFLHRFALIAFILGCGTLPFLTVYVSTDEMTRMGVSSTVGLANPNYFGMWFGFCAVYFLVVGLETRNYIVRVAAAILGVFSLYMVAITVSRGPLLGVAIAAVLAFEKVLNRSFLPILGTVILMWVIYISGVFDDVIGYYLNRSSEGTGRSELWAWAFSGFLESWWFGVGMSESLITKNGTTFGPHNSLLFIALSSGVIPLAFYVAYLLHVFRGAFRSRKEKTVGSPFKLPLVSFAMLALMVSDPVFMSPWHMVIFCSAIGFTSITTSKKVSDKLEKVGQVPKGRSTIKQSV